MIVYWVSEYLPAFVFYTSFLVKYGALTIGPIVLIKPKERELNVEYGLIEHELTHVRQFYRTFGLYWLKYLLSKKARLEYELEAYREQLEYVPDSAPVFAWYLSTRYKLDITKEEALALLLAP